MAERLIDTPPQTAGHNVFVEFTNQLRVAKAKMDTERGKYQNVRKSAQKAGLNLEALNIAEMLAKKTPEEAELLLKTTAQYRVWETGGMQTELFAHLADDLEPISETADQRHQNYKVEDIGYKAGLNGAASGDCPHPQGSEFAACWVRGWSRGDEARKARGDEPTKAKNASTRKGMPGKAKADPPEAAPDAEKPAKRGRGRPKLAVVPNEPEPDAEREDEKPPTEEKGTLMFQGPDEAPNTPVH